MPYQGELQQSIEILKKTVAEANIKITFSNVSSELLDHIQQQIPLSHELRQWYEIAAPSTSYIDVFSDDLMVYNPINLVENQKGYRWSISPTGESHLDDQWDMNWVVIADLGADPIIAHTDRPNTPISGDIHGTGGWNPRLIAPSLPIFIRMIAAWIDVRDLQYHSEILNFDCSPLPEFVTDLNSALSNFLEEAYRHNFNWFMSLIS